MMTVNRKLLGIKAAVLLAVIPILVQAKFAGPPPGRTGAPGEQTCATSECHAGTPIAGSNQITLQSGGDYVLGQIQRWTVQASRPGAQVYGFQLTVRDSANAQAGTLATINAATQILNSGSRQYVEHTAPSATGNFVFEWTAPSTAAGPLTAYVAVNAANGNGAPTGDQILLRSFTIQPAAGTGAKPVIRETNPVVNGASFQPGIVKGSWVTIFGSDLAPTTRTWDAAAEIVNGKLPTELDGVSVRINGKAAAVFFISPTQLNVQSPDDDSEGPVNVEVIRDGVVSGPVVAQLQRSAPGFFVFEQGGGKYAAAVHAELDEGRTVFIGPDDLFGEAARAREAKAGDIILLFGTGFGPTDPPVAAGEVFSGAAALVDQVTIRFGDVVANEVQFAGLSGAGLYQFNVKVPSGLPEGDVPVTAEIGGVRTQVGVFVSLDE